MRNTARATREGYVHCGPHASTNVARRSHHEARYQRSARAPLTRRRPLMKRTLYLPFAAALALVAACNTDGVTRPGTDDITAASAKGGTGNPKFARQFTDCDFSSTTISCDYKISGLG